MVKLSQAQSGKQYKVTSLSRLNTLSQRMAILGLSVGAMIEIIAVYKHGGLIKTSFGDMAIDSEILNSVIVTLI